MNRTPLTALALTLVAASALAGSGSFLLDDFNDGDAVGWGENDFTGIGIYDASSGEYSFRTSRPIAVDDPSLGTVESHWERSQGAPEFVNGKMRGTIRANTYGTTAGFVMRDNDIAASDYGFYGSTSFGTFYIEQYDFTAHPEAPQTIIAMADPEEFPFVAGVTYNLEGSVIGDRLKLKAWPAGTAEPEEPILSVMDNGLKPSHDDEIGLVAFFDPEPLIAMGVGQVSVSAAFDNISFKPAKRRRNSRNGD
jgi:hypothetical protein